MRGTREKLPPAFTLALSKERSTRDCVCRLIGSPEKVNLFNLDGDIVRLDLEIEAHLGSTLHAGDVLILEKGNRLLDARIGAIKAAVGR